MSKKAMLQAIRGSKGFVTVIAKRAACSRNTVYSYIEKYPKIREAITDEKETLKDFAESKLFTNIEEGKETSLIFYLKTQAKDRGYVERHEVTGKEGDALMSHQTKLEAKIAVLLHSETGSKLLEACFDGFGVDGVEQLPEVSTRSDKDDRE